MSELKNSGLSHRALHEACDDGIDLNLRAARELESLNLDPEQQFPALLRLNARLFDATKSTLRADDDFLETLFGTDFDNAQAR